MFIEHGGPEPMRSRSGFGFEYIQGSGDDEDFWARVRFMILSGRLPC